MFKNQEAVMLFKVRTAREVTICRPLCILQFLNMRCCSSYAFVKCLANKFKFNYVIQRL